MSIPVEQRSHADSVPNESHRARLLEAAFRSAPFALHVEDNRGGYAISNPLQLNLCAVALDPPSDDAIIDATTGAPRDRSVILLEDAQIMKTGDAVDLPAVQYAHADGRTSLHRIRKLPLRDDVGQIIGLLKVGEDVTEQRRTEEHLLDQQRLVQTVFDVMPVWVFMKDTERRFLHVNRKMAADLGLEQPATGERLAELALDVAEEDARLLGQLDRQVLDTGQSVLSRPIAFRLANGECRLMRTLRTALHDDSGQLQGIVGFAEDVTETVQANEALQQMQRLDTLGLLVGGLVHDFNNILLTILGVAELAGQKAQGDEQMRDWLRTIELGGQRAAALCQQVLAFAGKGRRHTEPTNLNDLTRETVALVRLMLPRPTEIGLTLESALPMVNVDRSQVQQVLMNLLVNAGEALSNDGGRITLTTRAQNVDADTLRRFVRAPEMAPGPYVELTIHDNGAGMSSETLSRIFDPFFTTKASGTGLGLATALGTLRGHGGAIRVESTVQCGTTFHLLLPVAN